MDHDHDNPYAAPKANLADEMFTGDLDAQLAGGVTERELRAFVGKAADRYLMKWHPVLDGVSHRAGFNWAAFLFSGLYFPYRKMYKVALILYAMVAVEGFASNLIAVFAFGLEETPPAYDGLVTLVVWILCGLWANTWYLNHAKRAIAQTQAEALPKEDYFGRLARRGGTNLGASLGFFLLFVGALVGGTVVINLLLEILIPG